MANGNPLYHDIILEHYEYPRNKGLVEQPDATSRGANAMCGDDLLISLKLDDSACCVEDIAWGGHACAIGEASASMMTEVVKGGDSGAAHRWVKTVRGMVTNRPADVDPSIDLGDVESLEGVKQYPVRIKCALLAWEALEEALSTAERKRTDKGGTIG
ncbi:MAG: SUF system NifU family Fe-S cluster assembly protein [Chloroflexi bacterium]|nr:SUF system NifU family Fe-S cluster assembly protein [Chloroflexota bacterium]